MDEMSLTIRAVFGIPLALHGASVLLSWYGGGIDSYGATCGSGKRVVGRVGGVARGTAESITGLLLVAGAAVHVAAAGAGAIRAPRTPLA